MKKPVSIEKINEFESLIKQVIIMADELFDSYSIRVTNIDAVTVADVALYGTETNIEGISKETSNPIHRCKCGNHSISDSVNNNGIVYSYVHR